MMGMGMKIRVPLLFVLTVAIAGCATLRQMRGPGEAEVELSRGIAAAQAQEYEKARQILEPLYRAHWMDDSGERALMVLTALELDPRNSSRRLYAASDFATSLLNSKDIAAWDKTVATTLYLLSIEVGGVEQQLDRAAASKDSAVNAATAARLGSLPSSTRESWPSQLRRMREDRDALTKRVETLQATLRTRDRDLAEAKQELERIKKTLKIK